MFFFPVLKPDSVKIFTVCFIVPSISQLIFKCYYMFLKYNVSNINFFIESISGLQKLVKFSALKYLTGEHSVCRYTYAMMIAVGL